MSDDWTDAGLATRSWFKPAVGLWFAVLLGGGLFLMPANVHAAIFRATGIANPLVIAGIAALFGLVLGLVIAGRIAAATRPRAIAPGLEMHDEDEWVAEEVEEPRRRRVFSAREDIGEDGIGVVEHAPQEEEHEPARAFEEILAEIPVAPEPEDQWDAVEAASAESWEPEDTVEIVEPDPCVEVVAVEEAEFEPVELEEEEYVAPATSLGDLSLPELEARLGAAIASHKRAATPIRAPIPDEDEEEHDGESNLDQPAEDDPVIAFLRREATRAMPEKENAPATPAYDPQAALRHALDKLGKVGKPGD